MLPSAGWEVEQHICRKHLEFEQSLFKSTKIRFKLWITTFAFADEAFFFLFLQVRTGFHKNETALSDCHDLFCVSWYIMQHWVYHWAPTPHPPAPRHPHAHAQIPYSSQTPSPQGFTFGSLINNSEQPKWIPVTLGRTTTLTQIIL